MRQASLSLILFAVFCSFGKTALSDEKADIAKSPRQLQAALARLTATEYFSHRPVRRAWDWTVYHIDQQPSVEVGDQRGYRIVFRSTWDVPRPKSDGGQSIDLNHLSWLAKHADWHFVLVPVGKEKLPDDAKREILWPVPDEEEFRLPIAMGEGDGFAWFTCTTISHQHFLREQLALVGGDDLMQLALFGLTMERHGLGGVFVKFGDQGFAQLDRVVREDGDSFCTCSAVHSMGAFQDARATARLVELYFSSPDRAVRETAAFVLIHKPYRPQASLAYIDLIRGKFGEWRASDGMEICVELGLKDALPNIEAILEKPPSVRRYLRAYQSYRPLSGQPIDPKLIEAEEVVRSQARTPDDLARIRRTIVESADVDGAAYVALAWATGGGKGSNPAVNQNGIEMLRQLPRPIVEKHFHRLLNGLHDADEKFEPARILKMSQQVLGPIEAGR